MLKIRLSRRGRKKLPIYYVVVAEHTAPIQGKFVQKLGTYNPGLKEFKVDGDKVGEWISKGAQPSDTVARLLVKYDVYKEASKFVKEFKVPEPKPEEVDEADASAENNVSETASNDSEEVASTEETTDSSEATDKEDSDKTEDVPVEEKEEEKKED